MATDAGFQHAHACHMYMAACRCGGVQAGPPWFALNRHGAGHGGHGTVARSGQPEAVREHGRRQGRGGATRALSATRASYARRMS